ncbi:hypothetical protein ACIDI_140c00080 [Acidiphilium sp. JA12-A1]|nr:hypothetical protein ACIDI_140c00080 [Acidiphilium sp. JA12-A1]
MGKHITFIGLDVHKETITVALAESGGRDDVREYGRIANTPEGADEGGDEVAARGRGTAILL